MSKFTDVLGTLSSSFQFGIGGARMRNNSGAMESRNAANSARADLQCNAIAVTDQLTSQTNLGIGAQIFSQGRLSLSSTDFNPSADQTAATSIYLLPYLGNVLSFYESSKWVPYTIPDAGITITVPSTTNTNYDVFAYSSSGSVVCETVAWTDSLNRATNYTLQNGIYVKSGTTSRRLIGSFRTTGSSGQTESSIANRFLVNAINQLPLYLYKEDTTTSWTDSTASWRNTRNQSSNSFNFLLTLPNTMIDFRYCTRCTTGGYIGIGIDSTTPASLSSIGFQNSTDGTIDAEYFNNRLAVGQHTANMCEYANGGTVTSYGGTSGGRLTRMHGIIMG